MNSEIEDLNQKEYLRILEEDNRYDYILCELNSLIFNIRTFIIFPPYEKNYINKLKENFIRLKEIFKVTKHILHLMDSNYINEIQHPLNIIDEIELNIINKLLNDSLKSDGILMSIILLKDKLYYSLKNFSYSIEREMLNSEGIFNISQYKESYNIDDDKQLLRFHKEIFDILPL